MTAGVWALRGLAALNALWILTAYARALRAHRAAQFRPRPSTAQGLAGRYTPPVTLVVPAPQGRVGAWVSRLAYPRSRWEVVVAAPDGVPLAGLPPGARVIRVRSATRGRLVAAGARAARGEVVVVLPEGLQVGPGFVKRLVAPLVDPFVGAAVARVVAARPGQSLAARVDDLDRLARSALQAGRHALGAPVTCEGEPVAVRREQVEDVGGWDPGHPLPEADVVLRLYVRGFAVAYVEEAVALAPPPGWAGLGARLRDRTVALRALWHATRAPVRRTRVLEGPEKTDVRWSTRGAALPLWVVVGWALDAALRLVDTSWAPEALGALLVVVTFSTLSQVPFVLLSAAAVQHRRRTVLPLVPWLVPLSLGWLWTGAGAALAAPLRARAGGPRPPRPREAAFGPGPGRGGRPGKALRTVRGGRR